MPSRTGQRPADSSGGIKTRIIVLADSFANFFPQRPEAYGTFDLLIHCGSLSKWSTLREFQHALRHIEKFDAPIKVLIAGEFDTTLDLQAFQELVRAREPITDSKKEEARQRNIRRSYGHPGAGERLLRLAPERNVFLLDEGTYNIPLANGALVKLYASPFTPDKGLGLAFQYRSQHRFNIEPDTDIAVTHGPPRGVLDGCPFSKYPAQNQGSASLQQAVVMARPRLHCFGQAGTTRGAGLATWREPSPGRKFSWTAIRTNSKSTYADGTPGLVEETSHCTGDELPLGPGRTLFVNASSIESIFQEAKRPWVVNMEMRPRIDYSVNAAGDMPARMPGEGQEHEKESRRGQLGCAQR